MGDESRAKNTTCLGLRRRNLDGPPRETSYRDSRDNDESRDNGEARDNREYMEMKEQLIGQPFEEKREHFTERDVQKSFETNAATRLDQTKDAAKRIKKAYVGNGRWWRTLVKRSFPLVGAVRGYKKEYVIPDIAAGLSVGIASIPMGMSYALLAELSPAHGLYNNLFYPLIYMLLGTGHQVCVGVSAIESMLSSEAAAYVVGYDAPYEVWLNASIGLAFFTGVFLILFRILGLGVISSFLADPVLSGFSTGSALIIATSQLKDVFGFKIPRMSTFSTWIYLFSHIDQTNWRCLLITSSGVFMLWLTTKANRRWFKKFPLPGSLFVLITFIVIGWLLEINQYPHHVSVVGDIPKGFPSPRLFDFDLDLLWPTIQRAVIYSIMYFVIHISIAKTIAYQRGYVLDSNQEFLATGIAGLFGSFFQCYPIATSMSRSSIANVVGARTLFYHIANVLLIMLTITVMTPLLYYLPMSALASVIMFGVYFMMDWPEAWRLLKLWSVDFILWASCCIVTVVWGAMEGVVVAVALSLLWLLKKSAFPSTAVLGRLPGTYVYRNVERFPMAMQIPGMKIVRFDASLNFCNADLFEKRIVSVAKLDAGKEGYEEENTDGEFVRVVIVDASSINDVDTTAIRMLQTLATRMKACGRVLLFSNWKGPMRDFLEKAHFYDVVPPEHCFLSLFDAVQWAQTFYMTDPSDDGVAMKEPSAIAKLKTLDREGSTGAVGAENVDRPSFHIVSESTENHTERQWVVANTDARETDEC